MSNNNEKAPVGRPRKYKTPEEMQEAIDEYFRQCQPTLIMIKDKDGKEIGATDKQGRPLFNLNPPTITGLALALGFVDRQSIYDYKEYGEEFSCTIKEARLRCENYAEEQGMSGNIPPAVSIFVLKNYGWTDKQEIKHEGGMNIVYLDKDDENL